MTILSKGNLVVVCGIVSAIPEPSSSSSSLNDVISVMTSPEVVDVSSSTVSVVHSFVAVVEGADSSTSE